MQTIQRYLINQLVIAYINGFHGRNSKVYNRRLTLHRGVSNPITFTFKNEDQKAQDITAKTYELNIIDTESKKAVVTKNLTVLDDGSTVSTRGDASCTITDGDLLKLDAKFYNFSVSDVTDRDNPQITYSDTGYAAGGTIEVLDGAYAQHISSTSISAFTLSGNTFTSSAVTGRPGINNNEALHTIAIYPKNFSGTVTVQGTMESDPQTDNDYFTITSTVLDNSSDVTPLNFTGVFQNVRFKASRTSGTTGRIDKILYRQ